WQNKSLTEGLPLTGVAFAGTSRRAVVVGYGGLVLCTEDGGATWTRVDIFQPADLLSVFLLDEHNGWATGNDGLVLTTADGGASWLPVSIKTSPRLATVFFADEQTGWAAGRDGLNLRTDDGGLSRRQYAGVHVLDINAIY